MRRMPLDASTARMRWMGVTIRSAARCASGQVPGGGTSGMDMTTLDGLSRRPDRDGACGGHHRTRSLSPCSNTVALARASRRTYRFEATAMFDFVSLAVGLILLYFGAEWLVGGAARLAESFGIAPLIVGLT